MFLWKTDTSPGAERKSDFEVNAKELLDPYVNRLSSLRGSVNEYYFAELVVSSWLKDLVDSEPQSEAAPKWLQDSGLYAAIKNGTVVMQSALAA